MPDGNMTTQSEPEHKPVMPEPVLKLLSPSEGEVYVDLTAGLGGHAQLIAPLLGNDGTVVLFDLDAENLAEAEKNVRNVSSCTVIPIHAGFIQVSRELRRLNLSGNMFLADLGFSSNQVDDPTRGFSFRKDGPLDMRLNPDSHLTATELVNNLPERELAEIFSEFGEERLARKIARILVEERRVKPITTTRKLAEIVRRAYGKQLGKSRIDPATRTFQALRIAVNDEIGSLSSLLDDISRSVSGDSRGNWLAPGARIAMISFHSLEDRPIKRVFADMTGRNVAEELTRKPFTADDEELADNPRARSARLRAVRLVN